MTNGVLVAAILFLLGACKAPAVRSIPPILSEAAMSRISSDFEANFVDDVRRGLQYVPHSESERAENDSRFLRDLLKRNVIRGFECNPSFTELLVENYNVGLHYHELGYLELNRLSTCSDTALESMKRDSFENQIQYQHLFLEQLVSEMNNIIKYNESPKSPSGLKLKKLLVLHEKMDHYFDEKCRSNLPAYCDEYKKGRQVYASIHKVLRSGVSQNPTMKKIWLPPVMFDFFKRMQL